MSIESDQLSGGGGGGAEIGSVITHTADLEPTGYLLCDGSILNRVTYADLYAIIGDSYGNGDGATTFSIPDFRGKFLRGTDKATGNDPNAAARIVSGTGGNTGDNVGSYQADEFESHNHHLLTSSGDSFGSTYPAFSGASSNLYNRYTAANGGSTETRPKNINVNYMIKF